MPTPETLSLAVLERSLPGRVLSQGLKMIDEVQDAVREGNRLAGLVGAPNPEQVEVTLEANTILCRCTCQASAACRHVAALLLYWLHAPQSFANGQPKPQALPVQPIEPPPAERPANLPDWLIGPNLSERDEAALDAIARKISAELRVQEIREAAAYWGKRLKGGHKVELASQAAAILLDPARALGTALATDRTHRQILAALILLSSLESFSLTRLIQIAQTWGDLPGGQQLATCGSNLWKAGLGVPSMAYGFSRWANDALPKPLLRHLLPIVHAFVPGDEHLDRAHLRVEMTDPFDLTQSLVRVLSLLEQEPAPLHPPQPRPLMEHRLPFLQGWNYDPEELLLCKTPGNPHALITQPLTVPPPPPFLADAVRARLAQAAGSEERLQFIYALALRLGLVMPGSPATVWPEVEQVFLARHPLEQRAILARGYLLLDDYSELWEILRRDAAQGSSCFRIRRQPTSYYNAPHTLRQGLARLRLLVLHALACLPPSRWLQLSDLDLLLRPILPGIDQRTLIPGDGHRQPAWYAAWKGEKTPIEHSNKERWQLVAGRFVREILSGPLHWLGFVDLAWQGNELAAVRLHGWAELFFDTTEVPAAPSEVRSRDALPALQAEGTEIQIDPARISPEGYQFLQRITRQAKTQAHCYTCQLDAKATYDCFAEGATLDGICADWERLLGTPIPETIATTLTAWWQSYGQVRLYRGLTVIEFGDDAALTEMKTVTRLEDELVAELSPRLVVIREEAIPTLVAQLEAAGYMPRQKEGSA